jgi:hypothetical protein
LVAVAFVALSVCAPTLHTHAYGDHDHPEHHHGLAAHDHQGLDHHAADSTARVEDCDPGQHTVAVSFGCVPRPQVLTVDVVETALAVIEPDFTATTRISLADVRAHGPPLLVRTSPRAPPPDLTHPII